MLGPNMKTILAAPALLLALVALPLAGCGDPPEPVATSEGAGSQLPPGHPVPPKAGVPAGPVENETRLAGTIVLEGAALDVPDATVFVNVRAKGQKGPWLTRKYPMDAPQVTKDAAGARVLAFELRSADTRMETFNMNGQHDAPEGIELELHVCVKAGAFVDKPTLGETVAPFVKGKQDYALTLKTP
jgi:hypothetical protein